MKKNRTSKIIALLLSCLFIMGAMTGIAAFATENSGEEEPLTPTVSIKYKNVAYEDAVKLLYYVDSSNVAQGQSVKLILSETPITDVVINEDTKLYSPVGKLTVGNGSEAVEYDSFVSEDIKPDNLRRDIYAAAVVVDEENNVLAQSEILVYNVFRYCMDRLEKGVTEEQKALYTALLNFGAAVQASNGYTDETVDEIGGWANAYYAVKIQNVINDEVVGTSKYYYTEREIGEEKTVLVDRIVGNGSSASIISDVTADRGMTVSAVDNKITFNVYGVEGFSSINCNYVPGIGYFGFDESKLPAFLSASRLGKPFTDKGIGEWIANETVGDSSNSFICVAKKDENPSNNFKLILSAVETPGKTVYSIDFDIRWQGATAKATDDIFILKYLNSDGAESGSSYYFKTSGILADLNVGTETVKLGEWVPMRYEAVQTAAGVWTMNTYVNGVLANTIAGIKSTSVPTVLFETRYGAYSLACEFDNFFVSAK